MYRRIVFFLCVGWASLASASGVYKWVDEQGRVHYGEKPPARIQAQEMQLKAPPLQDDTAAEDDEAARSDNAQRLLRAFDEEREQKKAQQQKSREENARRERQCALARDRLRRFQSAGSLYDLDREGNRRILSDSERAASERRAQEDVARWCSQ